jgi:hypothetical protein
MNGEAEYDLLDPPEDPVDDPDNQQTWPYRAARVLQALDDPERNKGCSHSTGGRSHWYRDGLRYTHCDVCGFYLHYFGYRCQTCNLTLCEWCYTRAGDLDALTSAAEDDNFVPQSAEEQVI